MSEEVKVSRETLEQLRTEVICAGNKAHEAAGACDTVHRNDAIVSVRAHADNARALLSAVLTPPAPTRDRFDEAAEEWFDAISTNLTSVSKAKTDLAAHFRAVHEREIEDLKQTERDVLASLSGAVREQERLRAALHHERDERTKLMRELRARPLPSAREIAEAAVVAATLGNRYAQPEWIDAAEKAVARVLESKGEEGDDVGGNPSEGFAERARDEPAHPPAPVSSPTPEEIVERWRADERNRSPLMLIRSYPQVFADLARRIGEAMEQKLDSHFSSLENDHYVELNEMAKERDGARADANEYERQCELEMNAKLEARARVEQLKGDLNRIAKAAGMPFAEDSRWDYDDVESIARSTRARVEELEKEVARLGPFAEQLDALQDAIRESLPEYQEEAGDGGTQYPGPYWAVEHAGQDIHDLRAEVARLRGAMEFYARHEHWSYYPARGQKLDDSAIGQDWGARARTALDGGGKETMEDLRSRAVDDTARLIKEMKGMKAERRGEIVERPAPSLSDLLEAVEKLVRLYVHGEPDEYERAVERFMETTSLSAFPALRSDLEASEAVVRAAFEWIDTDDCTLDHAMKLIEAVRAHPRYHGGDGREA